MRPRLALACLLAFAPAAIPQAHPKPGPPLDKPALERYLRRLELWPPQVQVSIGDPKPLIPGLDQIQVHLSAGPAVKDVTYYISSDRKTLLRATSFRLDGDPFAPEIERLKLEHQPSFGPENAPLTLVVFSDFECPLCREEAKELRAKAPAEFPKDLRVVFVDFPLEAIHPWARQAALAGRCVYRQSGELFWDYHDWIFEHQPEINAGNLRDKILEWAKGKRLDAPQLAACIGNRSMEAEVDAELALGRKLDIEATPTAFLNGRRLVGQVPWQNLSQIIKLELEFRKTRQGTK
jgi:protein-disulfide isomerase